MSSPMKPKLDAMELQKKLETLASMVKASRALTSDISETFATELPRDDMKLINQLLEVASQQIGKLITTTSCSCLSRTDSQRSNDSAMSEVDEERLQRKRAESAAQREKVQDLLEIRERLAKVLHYKVPKRGVSGEVKEGANGGGGGNATGAA